MTTIALTIWVSPAALAAIPSGNQLRLDGVNDYANIPDNTALDLGDQAGEDFTIEAFFYVPDEASDANQVIFYKGSAYTLTINFNTATPDAIFTNIYTSPITSSQLLNTTDLTTGWHHVAVVYDNEWSETYDRLEIYLDGAVFASNSSFELTPGIYASTNLLSVGANSGAAQFNGWLDEARFSDSVRYTGAYTVPTSPFTSDGSTRALWHFDDTPCGSTFADSSGNANTLTAQNGATTGIQGAPSPSLQFSSASYAISESDGTATITVTRTGDPLPAVNVERTTADGTALSGADYTDADGTLEFGCGVSQRTFQIPIANDTTVEGPETIDVALSSPGGGAGLGSPSTATVTIEESDQLPDATISLKAASGYVGDGVYNTTGADQTKTTSQVRGKKRSFYVQVWNDGNASTDFSVKGTASPKGATVRYLLGTTATSITTAMLSGPGYALELDADTFVTIRVEIKLKKTAVVGTKKVAKVSAIWNGDVVVKDVVKAVVKVKG